MILFRLARYLTESLNIFLAEDGKKNRDRPAGRDSRKGSETLTHVSTRRKKDVARAHIHGDSAKIQ